MAEPISTGAATLVLAGAAVPVLTAFGVPMGLRADVLLAGFLGAIAAIALLNTVPPTGDTWQELLRTACRRIFVSAASAFVAGYVGPVIVNNHAEISTLVGTAFVIGAGAQKVLIWSIEKFSTKSEVKP